MVASVASWCAETMNRRLKRAMQQLHSQPLSYFENEDADSLVLELVDWGGWLSVYTLLTKRCWLTWSVVSMVFLYTTIYIYRSADFCCSSWMNHRPLLDQQVSRSSCFLVTYLFTYIVSRSYENLLPAALTPLFLSFIVIIFLDRYLFSWSLMFFFWSWSFSARSWNE